MIQKGKIGVTTDNIFPIIKKFLYSDQEIFLREIVSNGVDATQKIKTLADRGEFKGELGDLAVRISIDKEQGTITITDRGIGMSADEIDKYINQIALSSANEFLEKYKDDTNAIIGHFGLGFYSSFMVSKRVEIISKSYSSEPAVKWSCDGTPEYSMQEVEKDDRGTDIILHIDEQYSEFLESDTIESLLKKYCKFLPVPIIFGNKMEWKDGKYIETDEENIINDINPLWRRMPTDLNDDDYLKFYRDLYPASFTDEPMFWIHLNVDYPFNLTGILYFPKIKSNIGLQRNKIQLYSNQVFVTDTVEGIVPEFLTLLHGVIDSPDIPLNVSRSYLQSDRNVKKISGHISKKVADKLEELFKKDRNQFQEKWESLNLFIKYGMLTEEKFYDRATKFALLKNSDNKYFTFDEYKALIETSQTNKDGEIINLYCSNREEQYANIEAAEKGGYDVLLMDGELDVHWMGQLEQKLDKTRFVRVDSNTIEHIIEKDQSDTPELSEEQKKLLEERVKSLLPDIENSLFNVDFITLDQTSRPVQIIQDEFSRRMKDMAAMQQQFAFYGDMPNQYRILLNLRYPTVAQLVEASNAENAEKQLKELIDDGQLKQMIDLALLSTNMLRGEALNNFVNRSFTLLTRSGSQQSKPKSDSSQKRNSESKTESKTENKTDNKTESKPESKAESKQPTDKDPKPKEQ